MELKIKPYPVNNYPIKGVLVRDPSVAGWVRELQLMQFSLDEALVYPVPGTIANTLWGCCILPTGPISRERVGRNEMVQGVSPHLLIPEKATIFPVITTAEIEKLMGNVLHVAHPEFGMAALQETWNPDLLLRTPVMKSYYVTRPQPPAFVPQQVKSFRIQPVSPEEVLKNLEENIFPKSEEMKDKPLNWLEKGRLALYKMMFSDGPLKTRGLFSGKTGLTGKLASMLQAASGKIQEDFEALKQRNKEQVDKLLDLFKNNPDEALKYAVPLNEAGATRGTNNGALNLSKRWFDFSLFASSNSGSSGGISLGDHYYVLQKQYMTTAEELIKQQEYRKAAFIYMKLLKNPYRAAEVLEAGCFYQEAATIYLKYADNKPKAAECYEKGNMTLEAIAIYKELNQNIKVGDLYLTLNKRKEANMYYVKVVKEYASREQFVKASLVCKNKMADPEAGQSMLLEGWRKNKDAFNCLNNYFNNIHDIKKLDTEINYFYANEVNPANREAFLLVMRHEYGKKNELADSIRDKAYELIAAQVTTHPGIVTELKGFNPGDPELIKDTIRFKVNRNR